MTKKKTSSKKTPPTEERSLPIPTEKKKHLSLSGEIHVDKKSIHYAKDSESTSTRLAVHGQHAFGTSSIRLVDSATGEEVDMILPAEKTRLLSMILGLVDLDGK